MELFTVNNAYQSKVLQLLFLIFSFIHIQAQNSTVKQSSEESVPKYKSFPKLFNVYRNQELNVCNTWTFQVQLNSSKSEIPSDLTALPTNSYVICGRDSNASEGNGRLLKTDGQGNLIASKEIILAQQNVNVKKLKYFSNGRIYALGEISDQVTFLRIPVLFVIDTSDLSIVSSFKLSIATGGSWNGIDLEEGKANTFTILMSNDSLINISKLQFNGSLIWSRSYKTKNKPRPIGIGNEFFSDTYVAYNETDSGYKKGVIASFDYTTGNFRFSHKIGGLSDNAEYVLQSMRMINGRPRITALQFKNGITSFIRLNVSPTTTMESKELFTVSSLPVDDKLITTQSNWSEVLAAGKSNTQSVFLAFSFPDNYNTPITSKELSYSSPVDLCNLIRTSDGGSLVLSKELTTQSKIVLTKVDSIGMLPGCESVSTATTFKWETQAASPEVLNASGYILNISSITFAVNDLATTVVEDCRTLYCPDVPVPDTCLRTFFKEYRGYTNSILATQILKTNNDQLLVLARERENPYVANDAPTLLLFDTTGKIISDKIFSPETKINFSKIIKLADGNFIAAGYIYYRYDSIDQYIAKFDGNLNILWQKKMFSALGYRNIADIIESSEGDFYCYVADRLNGSGEKRQLLKLNSAGAPVWFKEYDAGPNIFLGSGEFYAKMIELGDFIYLKYNEESEDFSPHLIKIRKIDGSVVWVKKYQLNADISGKRYFNLNSLITDNSNIYLSGIMSYSNINIFMKISPDGDIIHSLQTPNDAQYLTNLKYKGGNKLIASAGVAQYPNSIFGVVEMDTAFNILRKQFLQVPRGGGGGDVQVFSDSVTYVTGSFGYDNAYWASFNLQKYNFNSSFASCAVNDLAFNFSNNSTSVLSKTTTVNMLTLPQSVSYVATLSPGIVAYNHFYCGNNPLCDSINITGPAIICDSVNIYSYNANRNSGCTGIVNWSMDTTTGQVTIISLTDSLIKLKIKRAGTFTLKTKLFTSCAWTEDSISVAASINPASALNLGADTVLCPGNTILLNAHSGFTSYLWQDGSTDSIYSVTQTGKYYVTTGGGCGNTLSDSITVAPYTSLPFDIGGDISICKDDTVTITAPAGFINYQWIPVYNLTGSNTATASLYPDTDTLYKVQAEQMPGCFVYDSINIALKNIPQIYLGNDTTFCEGQSISLDAGAGFNNYQWSTNATSQKITVTQAGAFYVTAFLNGCSAKDTIAINVLPLPSFFLGNDTTLCEQQQLSYSFNIPQATYSWNTGSTLNTAVINQPGSYWLNVTMQGCSSSDTVLVAYSLTPSVNLGNDTTLCQGETKLISAFNNNASYLWQDGSKAPDYLINKKGLYYVTASINNCRADDSIFVDYSLPPSFTLGPDTFICKGNEIILNPLINVTANYLWQDGSTAPVFTATKEGVYELTASNKCGTFTDAIALIAGICDLYVPSAFTPNHDGINDIFRVKNLFSVKQFSMTIYNRFGEKIYESNDVNQGWNGSYKGTEEPIGTYVWVISLTDTEDKKQNAKGTVTLIR